MNDKLLKVGISHGDINGVAYELIIKTFEDVRMFESCIPVIYGSSKVLAYHRKALGLPALNINAVNSAANASVNRFNIINCTDADVAVELSKSTSESEQLAQSALQKSVADLKNGLIDVLVTAPSTLDETSYLVEQTGKEKKALNILVTDNFRIALASDAIPLSDVPSYLSTGLLKNRISILQSTLIHDFMLTNPRIAVLSLNPGVGIKEQKQGKEEDEMIIPAIKAANAEGIICFGPYSADNFFESEDYKKFDAILAMYHDQGLIPFRSISAGEGALYTANLPVVRTAPDMGVNYEKAGKNESAENAFRNALYLAIDIFNTRKLDREIYANPLKKQYFERGADNEKLDLTKDE
jgi:4-hydroxythreonine-4-phosphate dehydrogenase